jgi:hypothetical protein
VAGGRTDDRKDAENPEIGIFCIFSIVCLAPYWGGSVCL